MTYVHAERLSGRPMVIGFVTPTVMRVVDISQYHVTVEMSDQRAADHPEMPMLGGEDVPIQLVFSRELAGQLIDTLMHALTGGTVDVEDLVHDPNCECGQCPQRRPS